VHGRCLSDGLLRSHVARPRRRCLVDGRLSDRGLGSRSLGLGSRSVVRGWFRCGPLLRWLLLRWCRRAVSGLRFRRLRNWIGLGRRVLARRSHRWVGWSRRFGWRRHVGVRRASPRLDRCRPRGGIGVPSRRNVGRCGLRLSLRLGDLRRCVDGHRRKLRCSKPG
jgi:hypothetical protein